MLEGLQNKSNLIIFSFTLYYAKLFGSPVYPQTTKHNIFFMNHMQQRSGAFLRTSHCILKQAGNFGIFIFLVMQKLYNKIKFQRYWILSKQQVLPHFIKNCWGKSKEEMKHVSENSCNILRWLLASMFSKKIIKTRFLRTTQKNHNTQSFSWNKEPSLVP